MRFEIQICNKSRKSKPHSNKLYCYITKICLFFFLQMIAKGKNASELFPAVVKNVASKNIEVFL